MWAMMCFFSLKNPKKWVDVATRYGNQDVFFLDKSFVGPWIHVIMVNKVKKHKIMVCSGDETIAYYPWGYMYNDFSPFPQTFHVSFYNYNKKPKEVE